MKPTLGSKIRYFRKRAGLTQLALELELEAAPGSVSRIESDETNPTKETILKIAQILQLNNAMLDYLIGQSANPASSEEVYYAKEQVKDYFSKKYTLAYLLDERGVFWDMSRGFRILADLEDEKKFNNLLGRSMPTLLLNDEFGIKRFLSSDEYTKTILSSFYRTYEDISFMIDDKYYTEVMELVDQHEFLKSAWADFEKKGHAPVLTEEDKLVYFNYRGLKFKMSYSIEFVPKFRRFRYFDFKPTNLVLKILSRLINSY